MLIWKSYLLRIENARNKMTQQIQDIIHCPLTFYRDNDTYKIHMSLAKFNEQSQEYYLEFLSEKEKKRYENYKYQARKKSFLLGRTTAKLSIKELCHAEPKSYSIVSGIFSQPVVEDLTEKIQVSIAHTNVVCASLAYNELFPVGIDIEKISQKNIEVIFKVLTNDERKFVEADEINAFLLWTAKESLGKALRTGITIPLKLMEINTIEKKGEIYHVGFSNFGQYKSFSFRFENNFISICYPSISNVDASGLNCLEELAKKFKSSAQ